jgi:hypothetical protein
MIRRVFLALVVAAPAGMARAQDMFTLKPIVKAVREGDEEKVRQALLKGENPNQNDTSGRPLLIVAVMGGADHRGRDAAEERRHRRRH